MLQRAMYLLPAVAVSVIAHVAHVRVGIRDPAEATFAGRWCRFEARAARVVRGVGAGGAAAIRDIDAPHALVARGLRVRGVVPTRFERVL